MHRLEFDDHHPRVDLGRAQVGVPGQRLDEAHIGAVLQHVRGAGVTEQMARAVQRPGQLHPLQPRAVDRLLDDPRELLAGQLQALLREEQRMLAAALVGPHLVAIPGKPGQRPVPNRHHAVLFALALPDLHRAALGVDVGHVQRNQLGATHAGAVQRLEDRAVTQTEFAGAGRVDDLLDLGDGEHVTRQARFLLRQVHLAGRVEQSRGIALSSGKAARHEGAASHRMPRSGVSTRLRVDTFLILSGICIL